MICVGVIVVQPIVTLHQNSHLKFGASHAFVCVSLTFQRKILQKKLFFFYIVQHLPVHCTCLALCRAYAYYMRVN